MFATYGKFFVGLLLSLFLSLAAAGERNSDPSAVTGYTWRVIDHEVLSPAAAGEKEVPESSTKGDLGADDRLHLESLFGYDWAVFAVMIKQTGKFYPFQATITERRASPPVVLAQFVDDVNPSCQYDKSIELHLIRAGGRDAKPDEGCGKHLAELAGHNGFEQTCKQDNEQIVFWRIKTIRQRPPANGDVSVCPRNPPNDGQGTGGSSDGPPDHD